MNESLSHFQAVCREAFAFLAPYGFHEIEAPSDTHNPYVVAFENSVVTVRIAGEGWGTIASVEYKDRTNRSVPTAILEPNWKLSAKRKKISRRKSPTQDEQIFAAARRIRERDHDILSGNHERLDAAAIAWQEVVLARLKKEA
ncbi:MAG: hypothetical protein ACREPT_08855 [Rudaea sp.]